MTQTSPWVITVHATKTDDLRIVDIRDVANPATVVAEFPVNQRMAEVVFAARQDIHQILHGHDDRLIVVVGPCSIHDSSAALEYAGRLSPLVGQYAEELVLIMRVYFRSPALLLVGKG